MAQKVIFRGTTPNDGTGDTAYAMSGKINDNFNELYTALNPPIVLSNKTGSVSQVIANKTSVSKMYFSRVSGAPSVICGTTPGGTDVFEAITDFSSPILVDRYFATSVTIYFTISGGNVNIQINTEAISV